MNRLRHARTRNLLVGCTAVVVAAVAAVAGARAAGGSGTPPPPQPLDQAIHSALSAPNPQGVTARIRFVNHVVDTSTLGASGTPLLAGAKGRLWASSDGHARLELQSDAGDVQIVFDGQQVTVYDATSNTLYRATLPKDQHQNGANDQHPDHGAPSLAQIDKALAQISKHLDVSGADPTSVAGQPAYSVRVAPKHDGGLLGAAQIAWDAARGVPLRLAVYAQGDSSPVLELVATDVSYGPVPESDIAVAPPAGAKVVDLQPPAQSDHAGQDPAPSGPPLDVNVPQKLVGLPLASDRPVDWKGTPAHVAVYGKGLGAVVVLVQRADAKSAKDDPLASLPTVSVRGVTAHELDTALGTVLRTTRDGLTYTFAGSLPPGGIEAAASDFLG